MPKALDKYIYTKVHDGFRSIRMLFVKQDVIEHILPKIAGSGSILTMQRAQVNGRFDFNQCLLSR